MEACIINTEPDLWLHSICYILLSLYNIRPLLLQRYGQQKRISCRSINLQVQVQVL